MHSLLAVHDLFSQSVVVGAYLVGCGRDLCWHSSFGPSPHVHLGPYPFGLGRGDLETSSFLASDPGGLATVTGTDDHLAHCRVGRLGVVVTVCGHGPSRAPVSEPCVRSSPT